MENKSAVLSFLSGFTANTVLSEAYLYGKDAIFGRASALAQSEKAVELISLLFEVMHQRNHGLDPIFPSTYQRVQSDHRYGDHKPPMPFRPTIDFFWLNAVRPSEGLVLVGYWPSPFHERERPWRAPWIWRPIHLFKAPEISSHSSIPRLQHVGWLPNGILERREEEGFPSFRITLHPELAEYDETIEKTLVFVAEFDGEKYILSEALSTEQIWDVKET